MDENYWMDELRLARSHNGILPENHGVFWWHLPVFWPECMGKTHAQCMPRARAWYEFALTLGLGFETFGHSNPLHAAVRRTPHDHDGETGVLAWYAMLSMMGVDANGQNEEGLTPGELAIQEGLVVSGIFLSGLGALQQQGQTESPLALPPLVRKAGL
jgi:hypothetical protein